MRHSPSFVLTTFGLLLLGALALRGIDTSGSIVALVTAYVASHSARKASDVWAASKDPTASTLDAIRENNK